MLAVASQNCENLIEDIPKSIYFSIKRKSSDVINKIIFRERKIDKLLNFGKINNMLEDKEILIDQLPNFGEVKDVPDDDNCGYHSIYFSLQAIWKTNSLKSS